MMDNKQREAMEAAQKKYRVPTTDPVVEAIGEKAIEYGFRAGAEWMHAHDAEKLAMAEAIERYREETEWCVVCKDHEHSNDCPVPRIIDEAKEDTDGR